MPFYIATIYVHGLDEHNQPLTKRRVVRECAGDELAYASKVRSQLGVGLVVVEIGPVGLSKVQA